MSIQVLLRYKSRFVFGGVLVLGLMMGGLFFAPQKAHAVPPCDGAANGRPFCVGYFYGGYSPGPQHNLYGPPPGPGLQVENTTDFINTLRARIACLDPGTPSGRFSRPQNDQNATSAAFTVLTMLGAPPGTPKNNACIRWAEWEEIVWTYNDAGLIDYHFAYNSGGINTRSSIDDVQYYSSNVTPDSIIFRNPENRNEILYGIKRDCGNPIGVLRLLPRDFNLQPDILARVNGVISTQAEPGDTIIFEYGVTNTGTTRSAVANCYGGKLNRPGYHGPVSPAEGGGIPLILVCPRAFNPGNNYAGGPEAPITAQPNTSYCRTLFVTPISETNNGTNNYEYCVNVVSRPYVKVFGGDVSAGNGLESALGTNSCGTNNNGAIVAWNNGTTGGYSGAGAQYAAQTPATITSFATAQGNAGGAPAGTGLSFANTVGVNLAADNYGGQFGSVPCIKNYYGERALLGTLPSAATIGPGVGTYEATSDMTFPGGTLNAGDRWTIYVDGDLRITNSIQFNDAGWTAANMPFLKVVVKGDIYIGSSVSRLDGVYIAQLDGATGGNIYTCATGSPLQRPTLANGAFYDSCAANKLTVNGALIANSVEFARTQGSLKGGTANEGPGSSNLAEAINFGPAFWMTQPPQGSGRVDNYDAITSLPPVL
jgi:hypothetical protein